MKHIILVVAVAALFVGFAGAETLSLTVDGAVAMAVAENLGLKQSAIELRTKERNKDTRWNAFLPSITATAGFNGANQLFTDAGLTVPAVDETSALQFSTGLGLTLPINAALGVGIKQIVTDYEAGMLDYEAARKGLERDVRKQFYLLLGNKENIKIQQANINLAQNRLNQARNNFENGLAPELEVLSAEVTVANLQPAYNGVVAGYESLMLLFKFLIGADLDDKISLDGNLETDLYDLDSGELSSTFMATRLDLRSLEKQAQAAMYGRKALARASNSPTLALGYNYSFSGSNTSYPASISPPSAGQEAWSNWQDTGAFSLTVSWPLDGLIRGSSTNVDLKALDDAIETIELAKSMAYENADMEIRNLVNNLSTSRKTIEANSSSVELARRNFELTEEAYNVGTRELLDVESAQNDYLAATQQLLLAKYEYVAGLLDLEYALNAPMDAFLN